MSEIVLQNASSRVNSLDRRQENFWEYVKGGAATKCHLPPPSNRRALSPTLLPEEMGETGTQSARLRPRTTNARRIRRDLLAPFSIHGYHYPQVRSWNFPAPKRVLKIGDQPSTGGLKCSAQIVEKSIPGELTFVANAERRCLPPLRTENLSRARELTGRSRGFARALQNTLTWIPL